MDTSCKLSCHEYVAIAEIGTLRTMTIWIKADRAALYRRRLSRPVPSLHGRRIQAGHGKTDIRTLTGFAPAH